MYLFKIARNFGTFALGNRYQNSGRAKPRTNAQLRPVSLMERAAMAIEKNSKLEFFVVADRQRGRLREHHIESISPEEIRSNVVLSRNGDTIGRWMPIGRDTDEVLRISPGPNHYVRNSESKLMFDSPASDSQSYLERDSFTEFLEKQDIPNIEILVGTEKKRFNVNGLHLLSIRLAHDQKGRIALKFVMDDEGGKRLQWLTTKHKPTNNDERRQLAIAINGQLFMAPVIISPISDYGLVSGNFEKTELVELIKLLSFSNAFEIDHHWHSLNYCFSKNESP